VDDRGGVVDQYRDRSFDPRLESLGAVRGLGLVAVVGAHPQGTSFVVVPVGGPALIEDVGPGDPVVHQGFDPRVGDGGFAGGVGVPWPAGLGDGVLDAGLVEGAERIEDGGQFVAGDGDGLAGSAVPAPVPGIPGWGGDLTPLATGLGQQHGLVAGPAERQLLVPGNGLSVGDGEVQVQPTGRGGAGRLGDGPGEQVHHPSSGGGEHHRGHRRLIGDQFGLEVGHDQPAADDAADDPDSVVVILDPPRPAVGGGRLEPHPPFLRGPLGAQRGRGPPVGQVVQGGVVQRPLLGFVLEDFPVDDVVVVHHGLGGHWPASRSAR
jgi:hypothetical protein